MQKNKIIITILIILVVIGAYYGLTSQSTITSQDGEIDCDDEVYMNMLNPKTEDIVSCSSSSDCDNFLSINDGLDVKTKCTNNICQAEVKACYQ